MKKTAVALGNFDGVHKAHKKLIETVVSEAKRRDLESIVYTFETHPALYFGKENFSPIMTNEKKKEIMLSLGVDTVVFQHTTREILQTSAERFAKSILKDTLSAAFVAAGFNYTFGRYGAGDARLLKTLGEENGFEVYIMDEIDINGSCISSSAMRTALCAGNIKEYNTMAYIPYSIKGTVETGKQLGRSLGFSTANVTPQPGLLLPSNGVYKTKTAVDGKIYDSITNIGTNPTVEHAPRRSETHILNFSRDIYGKEIEVTFLDKIRNEHKFCDVNELCAQIKKDIEATYQKEI